jgi:hypothetical protein
MQNPIQKLVDLIQNNPHELGSPGEVQFLKQVICEAAEVISRYMESEETFLGDPEDYGFLLFQISNSENISLSNNTK